MGEYGFSLLTKGLAKTHPREILGQLNRYTDLGELP